MDKTSIGLIFIIIFLAASIGAFFLKPPTASEPSDLYIGVWDGKGENGKILNVPYVRQKRMYCSEASTSMVLRYYGYDISQEEVHDKIADRFEKMAGPLNDNYLTCHETSLSLEGLKEEIDENDPVMIRLLPSPGKYRHTVVVVGYDEENIYVHDPSPDPKLGGENLATDPDELLEIWELTGYAAIIIENSR